jgi:hypothetical protein
VKENFMIKSEAHSDDYAVTVIFDATNWFESAADQDIINLIECDFGGDYAADDVVRFFIEKNTEVTDFFSYFENNPVMLNGDTVGFECHVNVDDAKNWIRSTKPHLISFLSN